MHRLGLCVGLLCLSACGPQGAEERGAALFVDPALSQSPSNVYACATCHDLVAFPSGPIRAGYPLAGITVQTGFWGGGVNYLLDAINLCYVEFMRGERLAAEDPSALALLAYLKTTAPADALPQPARPCTVVRNIDDAYLASWPQGESGRGAQSYEKACAYCHGEKDSGAGRLGPRFSILPKDAIAGFGAKARALGAEKTRHGKFFGISGVMPPFCLETLSDDKLADILAYLFP